ncbi:MAG: hypothetical protein ACXVUL_08725 [Solirubrobacteraceae bacterium]
MSRPDEPSDRRGTREWAAVILVPFGGFIFGVGWFAGLILLWSSRVWTTREKWIGTLVVPGGLATAFIALIALAQPDKKICSGFPGGVRHCTNAGGSSAASSILGVALLVFLVLAPIATAIYLAAAARRDRVRL